MATSRKKAAQEKRMQIYNIKPAGPKPGETLEQTHRRLAKQADQRLVRLEKLAEKEGYEGALTYAYGLAVKDAEHFGSTSEKKRFNIAPPKNKKQLQAKINDMIRFLNSPTSTKGGIDKVYKKRTATINEKMGTNYTWQELGRFWESKKDSFKEKWDSSLILKSIGRLQKHADTIKAEIEEFGKKHEVLSEDGINDAIYKMVKANGINATAFVNEKTTSAEIYDMLVKAKLVPKPKEEQAPVKAPGKRKK